MQENRTSHVGLIFILGLLSMLMPLAIDMYLPSMPAIAQEFGVPAGSVQMTLSIYVLGFAIGQLFYGPIADSYGRKPVIFWGVLAFALAAAASFGTATGLYAFTAWSGCGGGERGH